MAEKFDVASRLAEGRPAVDNIQTYVWACRMLGYANPDLTVHAAQVSDWYGSEDGLDLRALDADCAALEAAFSTTEDALARQEEQLGALSAAWQGGSADLSQAFLRRHGEASAAAAAAVRTTADALATLRDNLWHTVDGKVAAAIAADDRAPDEWLAAAHTVTTGAGDRAAASERINHEVKPFVDNDIRDGWLTSMRSALTAVKDLYEAVTAELTAEPDAVFDVPGELGPSWTPPRDDEAATVPAAASVAAPAVGASPSWSVPPSSTPAPPMPAPPTPAPPMPMPTMPTPAPPIDAGSTTPAMAMPPSTPSVGAMPDVGSGLSGLGQQLADIFGSLMGSASDGLPETTDIDDSEIDGGLDGDAEDDPPADDESVDQAGDPEEEPASEDPVETVAEQPACQPAAEAAPADMTVEEPAPTPAPVPPPTEPAPAPEPEPLTAEETPCEIAADELPQVGE